MVSNKCFRRTENITELDVDYNVCGILLGGVSDSVKSIGYEVNPSFYEIIKQKIIDFSSDELSLTG